MKNVLVKFVRTIPILLAMLTAGCIPLGSSPQARFYTLQTLSEAEIPQANKDVVKEIIIAIGPVEIPGLIERPQIVTQDTNKQLHFAEFDRWAEPLGESIKRVVAENLMLIFPGTNTVLYPYNPSLPVKYRVIMEIIRLDAQLDKEAVLVANWSVLQAEKTEILLTKQSTYRSRLTKPDYSSLVDAVSKLVSSLSIEMAQSIESLASKSNM